MPSTSESINDGYNKLLERKLRVAVASIVSKPSFCLFEKRLLNICSDLMKNLGDVVSF